MIHRVLWKDSRHPCEAPQFQSFPTFMAALRNVEQMGGWVESVKVTEEKK